MATTQENEIAYWRQQCLVQKETQTTIETMAVDLEFLRQENCLLKEASASKEKQIAELTEKVRALEQRKTVSYIQRLLESSVALKQVV
jgi:hypothetical protein